MNTKQALERIETITRLAGVPCDTGRALGIMIDRGTYYPGTERINLAGLWAAVEAIDKADRERWARKRSPETATPPADEETIAVHCIGGCGDINVPRVNLETGRCPHCGRDIDPIGDES